MRRNWKRVVGCFLAVLVLATLGAGCGEEENGKVTITIGEIDDFTGPAGTYMAILSAGLQDTVRYYNEQGTIPGVEVKFLTYDTRLDPSRDIPGYEWLKERGSDVIIIGIISPGEVLKPFSENDKLPLCDLGTTFPMFNPPGWSFCFNPPIRWNTMTVMKWVSETQWDYSKGVPKIAYVGWTGPFAIDVQNAMSDYCQNHPDQYEFGGAFLAPSGSVLWSGEIEKVKDCDIIFPGMMSTETSTFLTQYWARGYEAQLIGDSSISAYKGFLVDSLGWDRLDGFLTTECVPWWNEPTPIIQLIEDNLYKYRPGEAEEFIHMGSTYKGGAYNMHAILDIIRLAVEEVGAENFDGQAFYDAAVDYTANWDGCPEFSFTETKRVLAAYNQGYIWSAEAQDLVRASDWMPCVTE